MIGRALLLAACAAAPLTAQSRPAPTPASLGFSQDRLGRIDNMLREYVDSGRVAGALGMVMRHGSVAYIDAVGMADREAGRRMSPDALFRLASMSKAVTSVAVMMLVEEGRIALNDPVSRWIPGYAKARVATQSDTGRVLTPVKRPITIRDLLTHSAGISYGTDSLVQADYRAQGLGPVAGYGWYFANKEEGICASIDRLATLPIVAQPGERFVYGYNTDILGCVVERATGVPFADFLQRGIFTPLGMKDTRFFVTPKDSLRLTAVYTVAPDGSLARADTGTRGQGHYLYGPRANASGGAGLVGTARDYALFSQMLLNGGALNGHRLLSPRTVRLMTTDQLGAVYNSDSRGFGLGFEIQERPNEVGQYGSVGMYGWSGAYSTTFWVDPQEDLVAVLLVQVLPRGRLDIAERFKTLVYQALVDGR
jgi:CubicO group peptidase (beta-lactamase class C family)